MLRRVWNTMVAVSVMVWALPVLADPVTFAFSPGGLSQAMFNSNAQLESITGTSNAVSGQVSVDLASPGGATGFVSIDAASFRTGIDMRDEHLRSENWLNAASFPEVRFEITSVTVAEGTQLADATPIEATVNGNLSIHGVTLPAAATVNATYYVLDETERNPDVGLSNNALRLEGLLSVNLSDYGITIPEVLALKVNNTLTLELRLTGIQQ